MSQISKMCLQNAAVATTCKQTTVHFLPELNQEFVQHCIIFIYFLLCPFLHPYTFHPSIRHPNQFTVQYCSCPQRSTNVCPWINTTEHNFPW